MYIHIESLTQYEEVSILHVWCYVSPIRGEYVAHPKNCVLHCRKYLGPSGVYLFLAHPCRARQRLGREPMLAAGHGPGPGPWLDMGNQWATNRQSIKLVFTISIGCTYIYISYIYKCKLVSLSKIFVYMI